MMNVPKQFKSLNETNKYDKRYHRKCNCGKTTGYEYEKRLVNCFLHKLIFVDSQKYYTLFFILLIKINGNDIVSCVYIAFLSFIYHSFASASDG